jgi:septal ring factor EnvC (AmiA/AmiB activator)
VEERVASYESELTECRKKNTELQSELSALQAKAGDDHQVRYLEKENLRLMVDLKNVKKQLQTSRAEINTLRMKALEESPAPKAKTSSVTEKPLSSSAMMTASPSLKMVAQDHSRSPLSPKGVSTVNNARPLGMVDSAAKKRPVDSIESTPKRRRGLRMPGSRKKSTPAPGLGEPGKADTNTENASDCKQS